MQNISSGNIDVSNLKNFFKRLCRVSSKYENKDVSIEKSTKDLLKVRIKQLEDELQEVIEEKNKALKYNRGKINELNFSLLSIKSKVNELLQDRKKRGIRIRSLERKINKKVK